MQRLDGGDTIINMDIKDLSKQQLLLLAILLSFITSIATGITTVTLMDQAPDSVTVPINRVIQQTVEKIQQVEGKTTVQTVVVKEEDLVVDALAKNKSAVFILTKEAPDENSNNTIEVSAGRGFAVSDKNIIVADAALVSGGGVYYAENESGKFKADFISFDKAGFSVLRIGSPLDPAKKLSYTVPTPGDVSKMKVGQKIIVLGSNISSIIFEGDKNIKIPPTLGNAGALVINLEGEELGIALSNEASSFVPVSVINESLKANDAQLQ